MHELTEPSATPQRLTQSVLQIAEMLSMYRAELARVLRGYCGDIAQLANAEGAIEPDTLTWQRALQFVRFYQALFKKMAGDGVAMCHWLRVEDKGLGGIPLLMMVDDAQIEKLVAYLENEISEG